MSSTPEVRSHLEKVIHSPALGGPTTLWSRLLRYTVEAWLEGAHDRLYEKRIGEEALGRRPGYDPKFDRIVSVTKTKLTGDKLPAYYSADGRQDRVRFSFPVKGYRPVIDVLPETLSLSASIDYHRALRAYDDRSPQSMQLSVECLERVIAEAPGHAPSLALAAEIYTTLANFGAPPGPAMAQAESYARRALAADPAAWRAHIALGSVSASIRKDWTTADACLARARDLAPGEVLCHPWYNAYLLSRGRGDEAANGLQSEMLHREDLSRVPTAQADFALMLMAAGRYAPARTIITSLLNAGPASFFFYNHLTILELFEQRFDAALAASEAMSVHAAGKVFQPGWRAACLGGLGRHAAAAVLAADLESSLAAGEHVTEEQYASALCGAGRYADAVSALRRGLTGGEPLLLWVAIWPQFRPLHGRSDFQALLAEFGFGA